MDKNLKRKIKTAQLQMPVIDNIGKAEMYLSRKISEAAEQGADLVMLPEMFCCPYETLEFPKRAEAEGGSWHQLCAHLAAVNNVYLAAGSMPETDSVTGKIYNTAYVFDRNGAQIAKHRKIHLFDIDVNGGQYFKESDTLSAGDSITVFDTEFGRLGLCVCYDIRFTEIIRLMALQGAGMILVPAAFNMTTGPAHWELTLRAQAVLNQVYVLGTSTVRDEGASYHAWGHTLLCDPWGSVIGELDEKEGMLLLESDLKRISDIREQLPLLRHRRTDIYELNIIDKKEV